MKRFFLSSRSPHAAEVQIRLQSLWLVLALTIVCSLPAAAQTSLSTIRGTVTDQSGAVMPGAQVTLQDVTTNILVRTVTTDNQGNYEIPALKRGDYQVTATKSGFQTYVEKDIPLSSDLTKRVDIVLRVGSTTTQVTVSGAAKVIQTEGGNISSEITGQQYQALPIPANAYSSPLPVVATMPNVQFARGDEFTMKMGGQGGNQLDMGMDGVLEENNNTQTVNMEDVAEVKSMGVNNSAEYSRAATYDTITKRGANQFHGQVSYYNRNSALAARSFFEPSKPHLIYNTFNLEASGPIIKDKTFFYALWNGERVSQGTFYLDDVPTDAMRTGDFSQLLNQSNPIVIQDPQTGVPFPGNMIPSDRFSATALAVQNNYIPQPNLGSPNALTQNYGFVHPYPQDQYHADVYVVRVDHNISDRNSIFGRVSWYYPRYILPGDNGEFEALAFTKVRQSYSWAVTDTNSFSPNLVNAFTFGGNIDKEEYGIKLNGFQPLNGADVVSTIGLQGVNPQNLSGEGFPTMAISGLTPLDVQAGGKDTPNKDFSFTDDVTWSIGRHVAKLGAQFRTFNTFNGLLPADSFGNFTFDGRFTGYPYADFLLGLPGTSTRLNPIVNRTQRTHEVGLYATDSFKLSKRLTLTYGLRWDYFSSPTFEDGLQYNWDPSTGNVIVSQSALAKISPLYPTSITVVAGHPVPNADRGNFVPRISAAYLINEKTVVRGGYGIFNEALGPYTLSMLQGEGPFELSETFSNVIQNGQPLFSFPDPFPPGTGEVPSQSVTGFPRNIKNGFIQQYNLSVERQIGSVGVRVSYIGSRGSNLNYFLNVDLPKPSLTPFSPDALPYPQFVSAYDLRENAGSKYNALSVEAKRRVGEVTFDWNWTWANSLENDLNLENPYAPLQWSHDDITVHHRVALSTMWEIPLGKGRRYLGNASGAVDQIIGGWRLYWLGFFETGQYFTPSFSGSDPSNTNTFGGIPDRVCNGNKPSGSRTIDSWFDTSCFVAPPPGRFGNSGANILEGPGLQSQNLSLSKTFNLTERFHLEFSAMISNLFNHPNFLNPDSDISVPGAGVISSQPDSFSPQRAGPRLIEGRLRVMW